MSTLRRIRTWSDVDLKRLEQNCCALERCLDSGIEILRMVSANAYSFEPITNGPVQGICPQYLAVNKIEDGCSLRSEGVTLPILVLQFPYPDNVVSYVKMLHRNFLAQSIDNPRVCRAIANRTIPAYGGVICAHIKIQLSEDCEGFKYLNKDSPIDDLVAAKSNLGLYCEGIYTELSGEESEEKKMAKIKVMNEVADRLEEVTKKPFSFRHVILK